jgi:excisionase family DNA binding protein
MVYFDHKWKELVMESDLYTTKEVIERLRITNKTLFILIKKNKIKASKVGREYRYRKEDIEKFLKEQQVNY